MVDSNKKLVPPPPFPSERKDVIGFIEVKDDHGNLLISKVDSDKGEKVSIFAKMFRKQKKARIIRKFNSKSYTIEKPIFIIGRRKENSLVIDDNNSISIMHAVISHIEQKYYLEDIGSTNGSFVNGNQLISFKKHLLQNADKIKLGNEEFEFRL